MLLAALACSVRDPAGTRFETILTVHSAPETLRVARLQNDPNVHFDADGGVVFHQTLAESWANFGDSLIWGGAGAILELPLGPIDLHDLGGADLPLPFSVAWPQHAGLVGQTTLITTQELFEQTLDLPVWPDMEWIAFHEAEFELSVSHEWPFALEWLRIELLGVSGEVLGSRLLQPMIGIPAGVPIHTTLEIAGMLGRESRIRLRGRNLPMTASAPIQNTLLELHLTQNSGLADSARVVLPALDLTWTDSLDVRGTMRIIQAGAESAILHVNTSNGLPVDLELELELPQLHPGASGASVVLTRDLNAGGQEQSQEELVNPHIADSDGLDWLQVLARAHGSSTGLVTVRATDVLQLDLDLEPVWLDSFQGSFTSDLVVPLSSSETAVEEWPTELSVLDLTDVELDMSLENSVDASLDCLLVLGIEAGPNSSEADTSYILQPTIQALDTLLHFQQMDRVPTHQPVSIRLSGTYRLAAQTVVTLDRNSRIGISALNIPARFGIRRLQWSSLPEWHSDPIPEEVLGTHFTGYVENRLPVGGRLTGRVAGSINEPGVPIFDLPVAAANWDGHHAQMVQDTLILELDLDALTVMQRDEWFLWYEFNADPSEEEVAILSDQWLSVRSVIRATVEVEAGDD